MKLRVDLMPTGDELAKMAQSRYKITKSKIEKQFGSYLHKLMNLEFQLYKEKEVDCSSKIIEKAVKKKLLIDTGKFANSFARNYDNIWKFFLSISQSRKSRAGGSFENHVRYLFELLGYPFDTQTILDGKVDYLIPSESAFRRNRSACVVISIKRTLRERWRQVVGELASINAGRIYLLTADEDISQNKVDEMKGHNVNLVIWDEYKKKSFKDSYNVLGFNQFISEDLPSSRKLWERLT